MLPIRRTTTSLWDPFREMEELSNRLNRTIGFGRMFGNGETEALSQEEWYPACDVSETDAEYRVRAEIPRVDRKDVHVTVDRGVLTIQGSRKEEKEEKGERFHRRELAYGNFARRFTLPPDADEKRIDATFKDGVLLVTIPRTAGKEGKAKQIDIH